MTKDTDFLLKLSMDASNASIESAKVVKASIGTINGILNAASLATILEASLEASISKLETPQTFVPTRLEKAKMQEFMEAVKLIISSRAQEAESTSQYIRVIIKALKTASKIEAKEAKAKGTDEAKSNLEKFSQAVKSAIASQESALNTAKAVKATIKTLVRALESQAKPAVQSAIEFGNYTLSDTIAPIIASATKLSDETINALMQAQETLKALEI